MWIKVPENQEINHSTIQKGAAMLATNPVKTFPTFKSFIAAFRNWVHHRQLISQCRQRLDACDNVELARIAQDVGLSPHELRAMAELGPDAAKQLLDRMAVLHLDANALAKSEPSTLRDMQRLCSSCAAKGRCQRDLVLTPNDQMWRHYCPNADTLDALQSEAANVR